MKTEKFNESKFKGKVHELHTSLEAIRRHADAPKDITLAEYVQETHGMSADSFMEDLGIDPKVTTIQNIVETGDVDVKWIIPEIYRNALRLGYRKAPIWNNVIAAEEQMNGLTMVMPSINMSDAAPKRVGEGETIPLGDISYQDKQFKIYKIGRGIKITDEVRRYSSLNVISLFLEDFGVKLGHGIDTLAIDTLINGEQADGSESAPVLGIATPNSKAYRDFLKVFIRLSRIGRLPSVMVGGEDASLDTLDLPEFKRKTWQYIQDSTNNRGDGAPGEPQMNINVKTPLPERADYYIHGNIPASQELMINPSSAMMKFNAFPLLVESERIVSNQTEAFYASLSTGFAIMFRDARVILDSSKDFATYGFPSYMDIDPLENVEF